ncbi:acyltransferase family protein [Geodermatophilus sp. SYSU D00684]
MRYPALNGLRALAALAVVTTHAAFWSGSYTPDLGGFALARLDVGVAVFFTLSGFLLSQPLFRAAAEGRPAPRTAAFLWRRALRILPAYWLCVALALLFLPGNQDATPGDWLRFLTLTQIYSRDWHAEGLDHAWSLCTEVAFYLLLPLLVRGLLAVCGGWRPARLVAALGVLSVLGSVWSLWAASDPLVLASLTLWLPAYLPWFAAGMATAILTVSPPGWGPVRLAHVLASSPWTCWAGAAALFWVAASPLTGSVAIDQPLTGAQVVVKHALYTGVAALALVPLVLGDQTAGRARRFLASRPMHWAGEISYGVFLFHLLLLVTFWDLFAHPLPVVLGGTLVVSVAAAAVSYRFLERPLVERLRPVVPDRPPARPADGAVARDEDEAQTLAP